MEHADGGRELHETNVVVDSLIDVGDESDLIGVEGLGPIDVGDGHGDEFQFPVHGGSLSVWRQGSLSAPKAVTV
jgi:hypothetical protein